MIENKITLSSTFHFETGDALENFQIVFHSSHEKYDGTKKVIWICHALTANSNPEEWWSELVGPDKLINTEKYFVVCVNMPGSSYGTSGPSSINPDTGRPYFFDFPMITIRDMVSAIIEVRKYLGIEKIDLLIGSSIGGIQASEWSVTEPDRIEKLVLMATDVRVSPWLSALCEAQRMALEADQTFRPASDISGGREGLKCARAQALLSYRNYACYCKTQFEDNPDVLFAGRAASYERYQGEKLVKRFDAYSYWYLCHALDSHNVGRNRGGVEKALSCIKAKTHVVAIDSDLLFPAEAMEKWYKLIPGASYTVIHSDYGHDGFLIETKQIAEILKELI